MGTAQADAIGDKTQEAFEQVLDNHRGILFKVANTYCRCREDRADLVQEIAAQLWRAWPCYDTTRPVSTWMYRIALNVAISHVRVASKHRRHVVPLEIELHDIADDSGNDPDLEQRLRLLHAFIERQAPLDRALLLLYLEERTQREIGDILGISESNVSTKIGRLKQRLRDEF